MAGVVPRDAGDVAAWPGARAAEVQASEWSAVIGPASERSKGEHAVRVHVAMGDVCLDQPKLSLDVLWTPESSVRNETREIRDVLAQNVDAVLTKSLAF